MRRAKTGDVEALYKVAYTEVKVKEETKIEYDTDLVPRAHFAELQDELNDLYDKKESLLKNEKIWKKRTNMASSNMSGTRPVHVSKNKKMLT